MLDVLAVSGGFGASGPFLGDLLAGRVLQEVEDRRGLQRRQVCAELGHPVGAAAELHSAVPERGFTPGGHALRIVLVDDGVGLVHQRGAAGSAPRLDGLPQPVDHVLLNGVPVEHAHVPHLLDEQLSGPLVEPAGLHGLEDRGELAREIARQIQDRPRAMKMHTVGCDDLRGRHVEGVHDRVVPAIIELRVVACGEELIKMLVLADLVEPMAGAQPGSAGTVLRVQRLGNSPTRSRNMRARPARLHLLRHRCHPLSPYRKPPTVPPLCSTGFKVATKYDTQTIQHL